MSITEGSGIDWILAVDAGGSGIRAVAVDRQGRRAAMSYRRFAPLAGGEEGAVEYDPEEILSAVGAVAAELAGTEGLSAQPAAVALTVQRATFCLWEHATGTPVTNLISWSDLRSTATAEKMNRAPLWRIIRAASAVLARLTGSAFFRTASMLKFTTVHVSCRLKYLLDRNPALRAGCREGRLRFGTLDTWLLYRLSAERVWATDRSNAAATSLYNPFDLKWNRLFFWLFNIPAGIFPPVLETVDDFGMTDPGLFAGIRAPILALVGDQMAALFGHRCFTPGEVKVSKGSGGFVTINIGHKPRFSPKGLFPLIAWSIGGKVSYMLEGQVASVGTLIDWLYSEVGFAGTPEELDALAEEAPDSGGVVFLPTPLGLRFPYFLPRMRCAIFGLGLTTRKSQIALALYEGIAFRVREIVKGIEGELRLTVKQLKVDGGVSRSSILMRLLSASCKVPVLRSHEQEQSGIGAAYLAGLGLSWWKDEEELRKIPEEYQLFSNPEDEDRLDRGFYRWKAAVHAARQYSRRTARIK
jgi:glycerol kinase